MLLELLECLRGVPRLSMAICAFVLAVSLLSPAKVFAAHMATLYSTERRLRRLKPLGIAQSNMKDQFDAKYSIPENSGTSGGSVRVKALYLHPVKSCGAVEVSRAHLTKSGFLFDRCFAIAAEGPNANDRTTLEWRFLSQRTKPQMCHIEENIWLSETGSDSQATPDYAGGYVVLKFADPHVQGWPHRLAAKLFAMDLHAVPRVTLILPLRVEPSANLRAFKIHGRDATGYDLGGLPTVSPALPKLKAFLGIPTQHQLTIMRCTAETLVRTDKNLAPLKYIGTPSVHGYTDQQPVNINSLSSVHAVSSLMPPENQPLDAVRFRANIWIAGSPAYDEETWKRFKIVTRDGGERDLAPSLSVVCRTSRCTMPNVNLATGTFDTDNPAPGKKKGRQQPSSTLVEHRMVESGNSSALGYLGMHCVPEDGPLSEAASLERPLYVEVGDEVQVLERGVHEYGSTANEY